MTAKQQQQQQQEEKYQPGEIEPKWQAAWESSGIYNAEADADGRRNWFALSMFPYPSGELHIGHWYAFTPADAHARFMRMQGYNVLQPQGFDSFGLPAENAAIRHGIHPRKWTYSNIERMRRQFRMMGNSYDWRREVVTCDPEYYRWNQHFFLKLMEAGLAYRGKALANWCPSCNTTLANEQVKEGACERCETLVTKRNLEQWFIRITKYADELMEMDRIDWPRKIKTMQHNWIGRSKGATIAFPVEGAEGLALETFTTRIDTVFGVEFIAVAPESPLIGRLTAPERREEVERYVESALRSNEIERTTADKPKTGAFTGAYALNPFSGKRVPVYAADYVLATYGTGVVMGVPAHDQRDFEFAHAYGLEVTAVVEPPDWDGDALREAYTGEGLIINSGKFNGMPQAKAMEAMADAAEANGWGRRSVTYHIRDWLISRQRYWGTPIPVLYCQGECGIVPVPHEDLPVLLPEEADFLPTGGSPLLNDPEFLNAECPSCGGAAKRETDTMDTFMDSSWYHFRYMGHERRDRPFAPEDIAPWAPVHQYMGGAEHAVMHLLYARFFCKALRDMGIVGVDEPYRRLFNQGVLTSQSQKISKRSNPLSAEDLVKRHGTDAVRCYLMFLGPWDQGGTWTPSGINGVARWLRRVWDLAQQDAGAFSAERADAALQQRLSRACHRTSRRVTNDMAAFKFNTAIAALMELCNEMQVARAAALEGAPSVAPDLWDAAVERLLLHLAPLAPHIAEELWQRRRAGKGKGAGAAGQSVHLMRTPAWDDAAAEEEVRRVAVQVNGRVRGQLELPPGSPQEAAVEAARADAGVARWLEGREVARTIYIQDKLLNLVLADG